MIVPSLQSERLGGLAVGQADDVDRDDRFAQRVGEAAERGVQAPPSTTWATTGSPGVTAASASCSGSSATVAGRGCARRADPRVPHHAQQVCEVVVSIAKEPRPAEHALERVLDEILGIGGRAAQAVRRAVEAADVVGERLGVEPAQGWVRHGASISTGRWNKRARTRVSERRNPYPPYL